MSDLGGMSEGAGDVYGDFGVEPADFSSDLDSDFASWEDGDKAVFDDWEPISVETDSGVDGLPPEEDLLPEAVMLPEGDLLPEEELPPEEELLPAEELLPEGEVLSKNDLLPEEELLPKEDMLPDEELLTDDEPLAKNDRHTEDEPVGIVEISSDDDQSVGAVETLRSDVEVANTQQEAVTDQLVDPMIEQPAAAAAKQTKAAEGPELEAVALMDNVIDGTAVATRLDRTSIWDAPPSERGRFYEELKEANIGGSFPTIDDFDEESGVATSYKTIDLNATSYAEDDDHSAAHLQTKINTYTDALSNFRGAVWNQGGKRVEVPGDAIGERMLCIGIPAGSATPGQAEALADCKNYAAQHNVKLIVEEVA